MGARHVLACYQKLREGDNNLITPVMILKRALSTIRTRISETEGLANKVLVPLILLSSLKNYLFSGEDRSPSFCIPDELIEKAKNKAQKIVLVLDMDQTLIYSRGEQCPSHPNYFQVNNKKERFYVEKRPHLEDFLEAASKVFTIYVYTAGKKQYADSILDVIDVNRVIEKRFYRDSCAKQNGNFVKNLSKIKSMPNRMVLLDDNMDSIRLNAPHSLHSPPFEGGNSDSHLPKLFQELLKFYD